MLPRTPLLRALVSGTLAFSFFFVLGAGLERKALDSPAEIEHAIFSRVNLAKVNGRHSLIYPDRNGNPLLIYDIAWTLTYPHNKAGPHDELLRMVGARTGADVVFEAIDLLSPTAMTAAGTIALGISAKDLLVGKELRAVVGQLPKKPDFVAAALGAISGYTLGRLAARTYYLPDIESPAALKILADRAKWQQNHDRLIFHIHRNIFWEFMAISDSSKREECHKKDAAATKEVYKNMTARLSSTLNGSDLDLLSARLAECRMLAQTSALKAFDLRETLIPLLWFPVVALSVSAIALIVFLIGSTIAEQRSRRHKFPTIGDA